MKRILFFSILLFGCGPTNHHDKSSMIASQSTTDSITKQKIESQSIVEADTSPKPTIHFISFTKYIDSIGYIADTVRAKKISPLHLSISIVVLPDNKPFFSLSPTNHEIQKSKQFIKDNMFFDSLNVDYEIFLEPISIFAYYYRQRIKSEMIEEGIIEEWNFNTANEATKAFTEINKIKDMVYFNTNSFTLQHDNYLYIFHTRAKAFDITLRKFYKAFKQRRA